MQGRSNRTEAIRARFLQTLGETGNITETCRALELHRPSMYEWRAADRSFAAAWDAALELGADSLEDEARRRALAGSDPLIIFMLRALKPEKYRERSTVDLNQMTYNDYRNVPMDELRKRLAELRSQQDAPTLTLVASDSDEP
jgi:hypothetical protein